MRGGEVMQALDGSIMENKHKKESYALTADVNDATDIVNRILEILGENHPEHLATRKGIVRLVGGAMQLDGITNPTDEQILDYVDDAKNGAIHFNKHKAPSHVFI